MTVLQHDLAIKFKLQKESNFNQILILISGTLNFTCVHFNFIYFEIEFDIFVTNPIGYLLSKVFYTNNFN